MNWEFGNPDYNNNDRNWTNANNGNNKKGKNEYWNKNNNNNTRNINNNNNNNYNTKNFNNNNNTKNVDYKYDANKNQDRNTNKGEQKENGSDKKLKYDPPADYKYEVHPCICNRPQQAFECGRCHHYFHGRINERCKQHPLDYFLMDFRQCPYCYAPTAEVKVSKLSWAQIRKMEDACLPNDGDDL
ncbi:uncharacterized protein CG13380-like [Drosophila mojavensis]|uniref:uncharacterized protein CG13380-like n=1 Tax=Drosophila mojavensis TaxID=7230 RepID=UPI00017CA16E|nr:uncharacterized protein CG13380-like [Drosophila mojavensis]XP_043865478.1 uncharacterized protein CG13380-like [Drosophila mojavensis]XP_043865479.1 uncharacterized protein CG13380-like [Drosophila mojavensis]